MTTTRLVQTWLVWLAAALLCAVPASAQGSVNLVPSPSTLASPTISGAIKADVGCTTVPYTFTGRTTVGVCSSAAGTLDLKATTIQVTGNLVFPDNTYDIGASGATRPRTIYAGTSVVAPTLTAGGSFLNVGSGVTEFSGTWLRMASNTVRMAFRGTSSASAIVLGRDENFAIGFSFPTATDIGFTGNFVAQGATNYVKTGATTVASLPACAAGLQAARLYVTDANATHAAGIGTTVAGGGANKVPVVCDGTNWIIG